MKMLLAGAIVLLSSCTGFTNCLDRDGRLIKACEYKEKRFAPPVFTEGQ